MQRDARPVTGCGLTISGQSRREIEIAFPPALFRKDKRRFLLSLVGMSHQLIWRSEPFKSVVKLPL